MGNVCSGNTRRLRGLAMRDVVALLVVLAFAVGLLMPMLARAGAGSTREKCAKNLSGLGKALLIYANDYDDELPRAGGRNSNWAPVSWAAPTRRLAYSITSPAGAGGNATITSCFYLLVKYAEVHPKQFVCENDPCACEFVFDKEANRGTISEVTQAWDFGSAPQTHCSYAYHAPWGQYAATTSSVPSFIVVADRNPYIASPGRKAKSYPRSADGTRVFKGKSGTIADQLYGNTDIHQEEGQNVLSIDGHVAFQTRAYCGLDEDNIYTVSAVADKGDPMGVAPIVATAGATPTNREDAVLVHDPIVWSAVPER
jgi:hypothetical protein